MFAPALMLSTTPLHLPANLPDDVIAFEVLRGGSFNGHVFRSGDQVLVHGVPEDGDEVVLVTTGRGRPRFGSLERQRLLGDQGEPCSMDRWAAAGRLLAVARPVPGGWTVEDLDDTNVVGLVPQLSLFAA